MNAAPVVSVLIVNWHSGAMARALVANIRKQRLPGLVDGPAFEFIVVDNASGADEAKHLDALEDEPDVTVVRSAQNSGYGAGMNLAHERATGQYVLVTNPDVMLFRGSVSAMIEHLSANPTCGMVGPKSYLDARRFFQLPPTELPSLCDLASEMLARAWSPWGRRHAMARSRRAAKQWTASTPMSVSQLSGFCFLMPASLATELGPFDPHYPFYYEDSDLCMRLQRKGFTCDYVPRAEAVHFFNRSAGQAQDASWSHYEVSKRRFYAARYGFVGGLVARGLMAIGRLAPGGGHLFAEPEVLGEAEDVPVLEVPGKGAYIAEISSDPGFVFAAGRLDIAHQFKIPDAVWDGLVDTTYFVRFVDRRSLTVRGMVSIQKVGGSKPIDAEVASAELVHA